MIGVRTHGQLDIDENAVWSLMLASGYLNVSDSRTLETSSEWDHIYGVSIINFESCIPMT